ncbi:hypothetical protein OHB26_06870 [Nocardia sp. NBC_01503]|uniref:hypothetical protein n=1 Tax=Nocardia sp. NBC_01503 TaxID=2975997 RepID=UPI002E7AB4F5|nr:hypothetical protein [Nocardia sp. NBC_01503]WTL33932.1 hypothetical protein OHB26_06870 [Nocardia sp. NBC_01503]
MTEASSRAIEIIQEIVDTLSGAHRDNLPMNLAFRKIGRFGSATSSITLDGRLEAVYLADSVYQLLLELKEVMARPGAGTWINFELHISRDLKAETRFGYSSEVDWPGSWPAVEDYLLELDRYPRDSEKIPEWWTEIVNNPQPQWEPSAEFVAEMDRRFGRGLPTGEWQPTVRHPRQRDRSAGNRAVGQFSTAGARVSERVSSASARCQRAPTKCVHRAKRSEPGRSQQLSKEHVMSINLTAQDTATLRTAAYGAVSLYSAASSKPHKVSATGTVALLSATGPVGHALSAKARDIKLTGKNVAELADQVLPALSAAVTLLAEQDPAEAENFRSTVLVAIDTAAVEADQSSPAAAEMTRKISVALHIA